jgi:hypothetical protein
MTFKPIIKFDGRRVENLATIFPSEHSEKYLIVNFNGQYYHITLSKLEKVIKRHKKIHEIKETQRKFDEKKGVKKWRRKTKWGTPISNFLITASIWRFL